MTFMKRTWLFTTVLQVYYRAYTLTDQWKPRARFISITFVDTKKILNEAEHDIINYRLWKKLWKPLYNSHRNTYSVVKLESPLNVRFLIWVMLLKVSTLKGGEDIIPLRYQT